MPRAKRLYIGCITRTGCSEWRSAKHNNSQGFYLYTYEPGGNRVEIYSGSFLVMAPDWEPVTWDEEERGTGVYWGATLPDSFIEYGTPNVQGETTARAPELLKDAIASLS